jgi:hypothetical protein
MRWGGLVIACVVIAVYCLGPRFNPSFHWHTGPALAQSVYFRGTLVAGVAWSEGVRRIPNDCILHWATGHWRWVWTDFQLDANRGPFGWFLALTFPLWSLGALGAAVSALAYRGYRRRSAVKANSCASCNYDLSGLPPSSPCPECASAIPAPPPDS